MIPRLQLTRNIQTLGGRTFTDWILATANEPDAVVLDAYEQQKLPHEATQLPQLKVQGNVQLLWETNRHMEINVETGLPAFLLTSERYDEGWRAYVDKLQAPVVRCNGILRGVWVPAGTHRVSFRFVPPKFLMGLALSTLYWLALGGALYLFKKR